ncbi:MAG: putative zinc protease [Legionellaceae bacterium]
MLMRVVIFIFCLIFTLSAVASPIIEYQLNNGLKIIVKEDHRAPLVAIQLWYKVGGSYEHEGLTGISHALEHMMSKGTPRYPKGVFSQIIASNGGLKSATTGADFTFYFSTVTPDKLPLIFELEADRMNNLLFNPTDLAKELQVILAERLLRTDNNPLGTLSERLRATAFLSSPYHHPVVGWPQDIKQFTVFDLRKWYQSWYAPNNATLIVIGDIKPYQVYAQAKKYFGPLKSKKIPLSKSEKEVKPLGKRKVIVHFPAKNFSLMLGYTVPSIKTAKQVWEPYGFIILASLLNKQAEQFVQEKTFIRQFKAEYIPYSRLNNLFVMHSTLKSSKDIHKLNKKISEIIKFLQTNYVNPTLLERVKKQLIAQRIYHLDNIVEQAREIGRLESIGLSWRVFNDFEIQINQITAQQLQNIARTYFTDDNLTMAILEPQ